MDCAGPGSDTQHVIKLSHSSFALPAHWFTVFTQVYSPLLRLTREETTTLHSAFVSLLFRTARRNKGATVPP